MTCFISHRLLADETYTADLREAAVPRRLLPPAADQGLAPPGQALEAGSQK